MLVSVWVGQQGELHNMLFDMQGCRRGVSDTPKGYVNKKILKIGSTPSKLASVKVDNSMAVSMAAVLALQRILGQHINAELENTRK